MTNLFRSVSTLLAIVILLSSLTACNVFDKNTDINVVSEEYWLPDEGITARKPKFENLSTSSVTDALRDLAISLLATDLSFHYHVFDAYIELSGRRISGICFTTLTEMSQNEEGNIGFLSGFIPFESDLVLSEKQISDGIPIHPGDENNEHRFYWTYLAEPQQGHFVKEKQYVRYGVDGHGAFYVNSQRITAQKPARAICDTSIGSLYSYDENRWIYLCDFGNYLSVSGSPLHDVLDFSTLAEELNVILATQGKNYFSSEVLTSVYYSHNALTSYLLSLQTETFLNYNVEELLSLIKEIDPMECIRISADGLVVVELSPEPPASASALCKWLVGAACAIAIVASVSGSFLGIPPVVSGAIIGPAIETFSHVVIQGRALETVSVRRLIISSVAGAISAPMGLFGDSMVGGTVEAVNCLWDGGTLADAGRSFAIGTAAGLALGIAFKGVTAAIRKISKPKLPVTPISSDDLIIMENSYNTPLSEMAVYKSTKASQIGDIDTYRNLQKNAVVGDMIEAHHIPSAKYMSKVLGVKPKDAVAINISQKSHRLTITHGGNAARDKWYLSLTPQEALRLDLSNMRAISRAEGTLDEMTPYLDDLVDALNEKFPNVKWTD